MKFQVSNSLQYQWIRILQLAGYHSHQDSFIRRAGADFYPRWHLYVQSETTEFIVFNLHLDQRRPVYQGATAHAGDYDSDIVKSEALRIQQIFNDNVIK